MQTYFNFLTGKSRSHRADAHLGFILAAVAGAVNAGGFLAVGQYTSHMTGILSSVADFIVLDAYAAAGFCAVYLFAFIAGASVCSLLVNWARLRRMQAEYALALLLEAALLLLFACIATLSVHFTIALLCFIMGLQNAVITKISGAVIRTTHVTGLATDIGIEIGRFFFSRIHPSGAPEVRMPRLKLHAGLIGCFLGGGIVGAFLFHAAGFIAALPFAAILAAIASAPLLEDLRSRQA